MQRKKEKEKEKSISYKVHFIAKSSINLPGIPFQTNENPHEQDPRTIIIIIKN